MSPKLVNCYPKILVPVILEFCITMSSYVITKFGKIYRVGKIIIIIILFVWMRKLRKEWHQSFFNYLGYAQTCQLVWCRFQQRLYMIEVIKNHSASYRPFCLIFMRFQTNKYLIVGWTEGCSRKNTQEAQHLLPRTPAWFLRIIENCSCLVFQVGKPLSSLSFENLVPWETVWTMQIRIMHLVWWQMFLPKQRPSLGVVLFHWYLCSLSQETCSLLVFLPSSRKLENSSSF